MKVLRLVAAAFIVLVLAYGGWLFHVIAAQSDKDEVRTADVIIVLGALPRPDGQPSPMLRDRVEHGVELYKEGWAPRLMLVGGAVGGRANQAEVMAQVASGLGVPGEALILEGRPRTTAESARHSREAMEEGGLKSALLVSSPFHMARALTMYRDAGVVAYGSPASDRNGADDSPVWRQGWNWVREAGAFTLYFLHLSP